MMDEITRNDNNYQHSRMMIERRTHMRADNCQHVKEDDHGHIETDDFFLFLDPLSGTPYHYPSEKHSVLQL